MKKKKGLQNKPKKNYEDKYYRCNMKGHWSHTCRTPKHFVDIYQASTKEKKKWGIEMNFTNHSDPVDLLVFLNILNGEGITHLDVSNFFVDSNKKKN
jgi:hypothetical protein